MDTLSLSSIHDFCLDFSGSLLNDFLAHRGAPCSAIESYNDWISRTLEKQVRGRRLVVPRKDGLPNDEVVFEVLPESFRKPTIRRDGVDVPLYPHVARDHMNETYGFNLIIRAKFVDKATSVRNPQYTGDVLCDVNVGKFPVMLGSDLCWLKGLSNEERIALGECAVDPLGYFIIRGAERVILWQEKLRTNRVFVFADTTRKRNKKRLEIVAWMTCTTLRGSTVVKMFLVEAVDLQKCGSFNGLSSTQTIVAPYADLSIRVPEIQLDFLKSPINAFFLFWFLHPRLATDTASSLTRADIVEYATHLVYQMSQRTEEAQRKVRLFVESAIQFSHIPESYQEARRVLLRFSKDASFEEASSAPGTVNASAASSSTRLKMANKEIITEANVVKKLLDELFPQIPISQASLDGTTAAYSERIVLKSRLVALMISRLVCTHLELRPLDDRDSWANKKLDSPGKMMSQLFSRLWNSKMMSTQNEILNYFYQNRSLASSSTVNVLSSFINQNSLNFASDIVKSFTTNLWGSKSRQQENITEVLKRDSMQSVESQLTKINVSIPRQAKQPQTRVVQSSQIGYVCPAETPEGEACGLVKNMSLSVNVTLEDEFDVVHMLLVHMTHQHRPLLCRSSVNETDLPLLLNDVPVGWVREEDIHVLIESKRRGYLPRDCAILHNRIDGCITMSIDSGRLVRPLHVVEKGVLRVDRLGLRHASWPELFASGCVEIVDALEQESIHLAMSEESLFVHRQSIETVDRMLSVMDSPPLHMEVDALCQPFEFDRKVAERMVDTCHQLVLSCHRLLNRAKLSSMFDKFRLRLKSAPPMTVQETMSWCVDHFKHIRTTMAVINAKCAVRVLDKATNSFRTLADALSLPKVQQPQKLFDVLNPLLFLHSDELSSLASVVSFDPDTLSTMPTSSNLFDLFAKGSFVSDDVPQQLVLMKVVDMATIQEHLNGLLHRTELRGFSVSSVRRLYQAEFDFAQSLRQAVFSIHLASQTSAPALEDAKKANLMDYESKNMVVRSSLIPQVFLRHRSYATLFDGVFEQVFDSGLLPDSVIGPCGELSQKDAVFALFLAILRKQWNDPLFEDVVKRAVDFLDWELMWLERCLDRHLTVPNNAELPVELGVQEYLSLDSVRHIVAIQQESANVIVSLCQAVFADVRFVAQVCMCVQDLEGEPWAVRVSGTVLANFNAFLERCARNDKEDSHLPPKRSRLIMEELCRADSAVEIQAQTSANTSTASGFTGATLLNERPFWIGTQELHSQSCKQWLEKVTGDSLFANAERTRLLSVKSILRRRLESWFTHCEIDPSAMWGLSMSLVPMPEHNQAPRNMYACSQMKQGIGMCATNYRHRQDTTAKVLLFPTRPLVETQSYRYPSMLDSSPAGQTLMIAIAPFYGWNQEDSFVIKRSAIDRGVGMSVKYSSYRTSFACKGPYTEEKHGLSDEYRVPEAQRAEFHSISQSGLPKVGTHVTTNDVLIAKWRKFTPRDGGSSKIESDPKRVNIGESGVVDKVFVSRGGSDPQQSSVCVTIRILRRPEIGDKFASRSAQKGTISVVLIDDSDMPFISSGPNKGMQPDMLINPHCIPSRMTIGKMFEFVVGQIAASQGLRYNSTAFRPMQTEIESIEAKLRNHNFEPDSLGMQTMVSGQSGVEYQAKIFTGPVYYQALRHQVSDKIQVRSRGAIKIDTHQPVGGRSRQGGQRFGEMERDSLISHGAAHLLTERMCHSSDAIQSVFCRRCGSLAESSGEKRSYVCRLCPVSQSSANGSGSLQQTDDTQFGVAVIPAILRTLMFFLTGLGLRMTFRSKTEDEIQQHGRFGDIPSRDVKRWDDKFVNLQPSDPTEPDLIPLSVSTRPTEWLPFGRFVSLVYLLSSTIRSVRPAFVTVVLNESSVFDKSHAQLRRLVYELFPSFRFVWIGRSLSEKEPLSDMESSSLGDDKNVVCDFDTTNVSSFTELLSSVHRCVNDNSHLLVSDVDDMDMHLHLLQRLNPTDSLLSISNLPKQYVKGLLVCIPFSNRFYLRPQKVASSQTLTSTVIPVETTPSNSQQQPMLPFVASTFTLCNYPTDHMFRQALWHTSRRVLHRYVVFDDDERSVLKRLQSYVRELPFAFDNCYDAMYVRCAFQLYVKNVLTSSDPLRVTQRALQLAIQSASRIANDVR